MWARRLTCFSTPIATATTCPTAIPRCCSPASAWKTRMRWSIRWFGGRTAGSTGAGEHGHGRHPGCRISAGDLALPSADQTVRAVCRRGRQHLGARLRPPRQCAGRHEFRRLGAVAPGARGLLRQRLRQARPAPQSPRLRILWPCGPRGLAGRPRHLRRDHFSRRHVGRAVRRHLHRRQPALERDLLAHDRAAGLDVQDPARRRAAHHRRHLVPADRLPGRAGRSAMDRRLVRHSGQPRHSPRHLGPFERAHLARRAAGRRLPDSR